ncbi:N-lysine methyltransferase SETD6 isoform X3 [Gorilla gorilla gorilla]|uniref:N-lysine methyltransferase SETD6 isoform X3 n=1 Tax=Gorilla gorilla gorilla TaxID=9595 RepID=UPI00300B93A6
MATQAKRPRVSGGRGVQPFPPRLTPSFAEPSACAPSAPSRGSRAPLRSSPPPPKARSALAPRSPAVPSGLSGGRTWSLRALISGGGARGRRRPGSCGLLPELVPAGGAGAESQERVALQSQSGWVPLLLALLHELQAPASRWRPYFALWPELGRLEHPMFCFQEPLEEEEDEKEPNSPMMVPAADILNHLANHNANLEYSANCLRMVATQPIPKGHEIFNTYGQMANWQLIHMYGFVEPYPDNTDDTADIQMVTVREAALQGTKTEAERLLVYERWDFLCKLEMVGEEGAFVIGREEVLTEEELTTTLKVLCMPAEEFRELKDQDGEGDDKREEGSLTITNIPKLKASWRQLLQNSVLLTLQTYATDLKTDQGLLSNKEVYAKLSWREQQALQVRYGQKMILHQLLELTS